MAAAFNQCQFIGRLGKDPDFSVTPQGKSVAKFSLAVDQGKDQKPMWLNIVAWEKLAETVEKYAAKGMQVFIQGRLSLRQYDDREGVKRTAVEIIASTMQLLDSKRETTQETSSTRASTSSSDEFDPFLDSNEPF